MAVGLLLAVGLSCSSSTSSSAPAQGPAGVIMAQQQQVPAVRNTPIPPGAQFTISCTTIGGPDHVARSQAMRQQLLKLDVPVFDGNGKRTGTRLMPDWHVIHGDGQSQVNYGFYADLEDPRQAADLERARADQRSLASMVNLSNGSRLFPYTPFVRLDSSDPPAPAEWNLASAKGFWSLQVGAYRGQNRKQMAVDTVRRCREQQPPIEAYFYHGPSISSVCIGAWPRNAVREQQSDTAASRDPNQPLLVLGPGTVRLPPKARVVTPAGETVKVVEPVLEVLDPTLAKTMRENPHHAVDGYANRRKLRTRDGGMRDVYDPSFLVQIPTSLREASPGQRPSLPAELYQPPETPAEGRLRSISGN